MSAMREAGRRGGARRGLTAARRGIRRSVSGLVTAVRFLTVLSLPRRSESEREGVATAGAFFPVVGLVVGAPVALILAAPIPPLLRAAFALGVWIAVTGGLHEDGWMDAMDAGFAPVDRARRLEILGDPRVGAHGVTGAGVLLLVRFAALASVPPTAALAAPVFGRWGMALSLAWAPPARGSGLGATFAAHPRPFAASGLAAVLLGALAFLADPVRLGVAGVAAAMVALPWALFLVGRLGGLNGDGHGAVGLVAETVALCAFVPFAGGGG